MATTKRTDAVNRMMDWLLRTAAGEYNRGRSVYGEAGNEIAFGSVIRARVRNRRIGRVGRWHEDLLDVDRQRQVHGGHGARLDVRLVVVGRTGAGAGEALPG